MCLASCGIVLVKGVLFLFPKFDVSVCSFEQGDAEVCGWSRSTQPRCVQETHHDMCANLFSFGVLASTPEL